MRWQMILPTFFSLLVLVVTLLLVLNKENKDNRVDGTGGHRGDALKRNIPQNDTSIIVVKRKRTDSTDRSDRNAKELYGRVIGRDGSPVPRAEVLVFLLRTKSVKTEFVEGLGFFRTLSDERGSFKVDGFFPGGHRILVTHPRYLPKEQLWDSHQGKLPVIVSLSPGLSISGRVADRSGDAVAGALVQVIPTYMTASSLQQCIDFLSTDERRRLDLSGSLRVVTSGDGLFQVTGLYSLDYSLCAVSPSGHLISQIDHIPAGTEGLSVVLDLSSKLKGRVVNAEGLHVADAKVSIRPKRSPTRTMYKLLGETTAETRSNKQGSFAFVGVRNGEFELEIEAPGFQKKSLTVTVPQDVGPVVLEEGNSIGGKVLNEDNVPIDGALVWAIPEEFAIEVLEYPRREPPPMFSEFSFKTASDGRFIIGGLEPGTYYLEASADGYPLTGLSDSSKVETGNTDCQLILRDGIPITGKVLEFGTRNPVPDTNIRLNGVTSLSDANGFFEVPSIVSPAFRASHLYLNRFIAEHSDYAPKRMHRVRITDGNPEPVTFILKPWSLLSGSVVDEEGSPIRNAKLQVVRRGAETESRSSPIEYTNDLGEFTLAWDGANRGLWVSHPDFAMLRVNSIHKTNLNPDGVIFVLSKGGIVRGRALDEHGNSLSGAVVKIELLPPRGPRFYLSKHVHKASHERRSSVRRPIWRATTVTDARGFYQFARLETGRYSSEDKGPTSLYQLSGLPEFRLTGRKSGYGETQTVLSIGKSETVTCDLRFPKTVTVFGHIEDRELTVAEAELRVFIDLPVKSSRTEALAVAQSNAEGYYEIRGLPRRPLLMEVRSPGYQSSVLKIDSVALELELPITLKHLPSLSGRVFDSETLLPVQSFDVELRAVELAETGDNQECEYSIDRREIQDHQGQFFVRDICQNGLYQLGIRSQGYAPSVQEVYFEEEEHKEHEVFLSKGYNITNMVSDHGTGNPIVGATVSIRPRSNAWLYKEPHPLRTDSTGTAIVTDISPGEYTLTARHPEHAIATTDTVVVDRDLRIEWKLPRAGSLSGRLLRSGDSPFEHDVTFCLAPVRIDANLENLPSIRQHYAIEIHDHEQAKGEFTMSPVTPGLYEAFILRKETEDAAPIRVDLGQVRILADRKTVENFYIFE